MMNPALAENNWKTIRETKIDLVVLPWGATEAHNLHLPYATDNYQAEAMAIEAAKKAHETGYQVAVLPTIPFGVNTGQADIPLCINMNPSTQAQLLKDIAEQLSRQRISKLLIVNSHGGNDFKQMIREINYQYPNMLFTTCNWFHLPEINQFFTDHGEHAGEAETSLMMHLRPELVLPLHHAGDGINKKFKVNALNEKWAWTERKWSSVTKDTGIGNPKAASKEKGKECFDYCTKKIGTLMIELCQLNLNDQYC